MEIEFIDFDVLDGISSFDKAYAQQDNNLSPFLKFSPQLKAFAEALDQRKKFLIDRELLVSVLREQYSKYHLVTDKLWVRIDSLLDNNTFTITTAHQPNVLTGPLYHIYKILSCIKLCNILRDQFSEYAFVPIYVMGAEDHDFEEVNHLHLFGNTIAWERDAEGSVGRMNTKALDELIDEVQEVLGKNPNLDSFYENCRESLTSLDYGTFHLKLIHHLFADYGLVVLGMDDRRLKNKMRDIFLDDLQNHSSKSILTKVQSDLVSAGFKAQAFVRDVNLFLMQDGARNRIEMSTDHLHVLGTDIRVEMDKIPDFVDEHIQNLSPNVILRPLYQESILPNLAYVGGGGELAYWTDRLKQFEHYDLPFPILIRRDSILWLDAGSQRKMEKLNVSLENVLGKTSHELEKIFVQEHSESELSLAEELAAIEDIFSKIKTRAVQIDGSLEGKVAGMYVQTEKQLKGLEKRLLKAQKQRFDQGLAQLHKVREKIYPNGKLQERYENFLPYYAKWGKVYFDTLLANMNPLDMRLKVIKAG